jgi:hypothetical protein
MTHEECKKIIENTHQEYNDFYLRIDNAIKPLVDYLNNLGFYTCASCSSHIFDFDRKPISSSHAYVSFIYADEDKEKAMKILNHKFPKSKYYRLIVQDEGDSKYKNRICIEVFFKTRYNRGYYLKRIFRSLGIEIKGNLKLDLQRPNYLTSKDWNHTVFRDSRVTKRDFYQNAGVPVGG